MNDTEVPWKGELTSVQPRIRLTRSFDQRSHSYLGYLLRVRGTLGSEPREFVVAIGKSAHEKHQFRAGDQVSGRGELVPDTRRETADRRAARSTGRGRRGRAECRAHRTLLGLAASVRRRHNTTSSMNPACIRENVMIDKTTREPLRISTDGDAGPYIMVPVAQLAEVRDLLEANDVPHWVDEEAISLDGNPEVAVINLGRGSDVPKIQRLLDSIP